MKYIDLGSDTVTSDGVTRTRTQEAGAAHSKRCPELKGSPARASVFPSVTLEGGESSFLSPLLLPLLYPSSPSRQLSQGA